jgi:hypothetical protein
VDECKPLAAGADVVVEAEAERAEQLLLSRLRGVGGETSGRVCADTMPTYTRTVREQVARPRPRRRMRRVSAGTPVHKSK